MLHFAQSLTRHDHHQIPLPTLLPLVVRHKLPRVLLPLPINRQHLVAVHRDVDGLVHLVRNDRPDERVAGRGVRHGGRVDEGGEAGDGGGVEEFGGGEFGEVFGVLVEGAGGNFGGGGGGRVVVVVVVEEDGGGGEGTVSEWLVRRLCLCLWSVYGVCESWCVASGRLDGS